MWMLNYVKILDRLLNNLKKSAEGKVAELNDALENAIEDKGIYGDLTRPSEPIELRFTSPYIFSKKSNY